MTHRMLWAVYDTEGEDQEHVLVAVFLEEGSAHDYADTFGHYVEVHIVEDANWLNALS